MRFASRILSPVRVQGQGPLKLCGPSRGQAGLAWCRDTIDRALAAERRRISSMTHRILLVCLGNICRSPTAEGVVTAIAAREFPGLPLYVDSAGTANYHVGEPPDR